MLLTGYDTNADQNQAALKSATIQSRGARDFLDVGEIEAADVRFDANDSAPTYIGLNFYSHNASTSTENWVVYKFTYSGSNITRVQKQEDISWDNRANGWS